MSIIAVRAEGLSKQYRLGSTVRYMRLKEALHTAALSPFHRRARSEAADFVWALKDVSLEVAEGEVVGIIGRNGSGKSTLLKILSRITEPTSGYAELRGRVASLLEVGTGFHPELTGRENVYLCGAVLGMRKQEVNKKFDEIVSFAGVESHIDTPVKRYSSGMQVRLAFAVAAHLETDILVVDEVLAVGDLEFQKRCLGKMEEGAAGGRTVVFVSHNLVQVRRLCRRAIWLDRGSPRMVGPVGEVVGGYEQAAGGGLSYGSSSSEDSKAHFVSWRLLNNDVPEPNVLHSSKDVRIRVTLKVNETIRNGSHTLALHARDSQLVFSSSVGRLRLDPGCYHIDGAIETMPLRPGVYAWAVYLFDEGQLIADWMCSPELVVATEPAPGIITDQHAGILNTPCSINFSRAAP